MRMGEIEIQDYARQLLEVHGIRQSRRPLRRLATTKKRVRRSKLKPGDISKQP